MCYKLLVICPLKKWSRDTINEMQGKDACGQRCMFVPILRAGLGMLDGVLRLMPCKVGHIGLYRIRNLAAC